MVVLIVSLIWAIISEHALSVPVEMSSAAYLQQRQQIMNGEENIRIGGSVQLTAREQLVNRILMNAKHKEVNSSRMANGVPFLPSMHFFRGKPLIEKSNVFQIIKKMPKGN